MYLMRSVCLWSRACSTLRAGSENAYKILGVQRDCSAENIRAAFRELAKATHPDRQPNGSASTSTAHFVRVVAAYQILADPRKRAIYDAQLQAQEKARQRAKEFSGIQGFRRREGFSERDGGFSQRDDYSEREEPSSENPASPSEPEREEFVCPDTEVVEWLKHYRSAVTTAVHRREIGVGGGLLENVRGEFGYALRKAYHGPPVYEEQGIPACFEADERAQPGVTDILHLVSGHNLFGFVRPLRLPLLESLRTLHPQVDNRSIGTTATLRSRNGYLNFDSLDANTDGHQGHSSSMHTERETTTGHEADGSEFADLELHVFGKVIARATRAQPKADHSGASGANSQDCVSVYLTSEQAGTGDSEGLWWTSDSETGFLGTIYGLGETDPRVVCAVHGPDGKMTHRIVQHQTPMVKHMAWYKESGPCECRCRRASMLPSRYWIFAPRSATHNVGGWYIEAWVKEGRQRKAPSVRTGDDLCSSKQLDTRLHPAMYILAVAYKTLDGEAAQRRNLSLVSKMLKVQTVFSTFSVWCKRKLKLS